MLHTAPFTADIAKKANDNTMRALNIYRFLPFVHFL